MWEAVVSGLIIHIGKTAIDKFWTNKDSPKSPIVNQSGIISYAAKDTKGRTVIPKPATEAGTQQYGTLFGNLYLPETLQNELVGDEIALVLVVGEGRNNDQTMLFEADINNGYVIDLPFGLYSIFVFLLDPSAQDLLRAQIYAVGFPNAENVNLTGIGFIDVEKYDDIWTLVDLSPVRMMSRQPSFLDFILFDTAVETNLPVTFAEMLAQQSDVFGYYCPYCDHHVTSLTCVCGAIIDNFVCPACGVQSPVSDVCPNCYTDIVSLRCNRCYRELDTIACPNCRNLFPV